MILAVVLRFLVISDFLDVMIFAPVQVNLLFRILFFLTMDVFVLCVSPLKIERVGSKMACVCWQTWVFAFFFFTCGFEGKHYESVLRDKIAAHLLRGNC